MQVDYKLVRQLLDSTAPDLSPAVLHGALTGFLCSGGELDQDILPDLLETAIPPVVAQLVERLASETRTDLQAVDYGFQLLLPADDSSLAQRVEALSQWCDWFNLGFAAGFMRPQTDLSAELLEILNDFSQLAEADAVDEDDDGDAEQDEANFMELVEYVRMAAISLYQQLNDAAASGDSVAEEPEQLFADPDDQLLH